MQLSYFLNTSSSLFEAGKAFFVNELDVELNALTAQAIPPRTFLKGYADKLPALDKVREVYFLGNLTDELLRANAARRRGEVDLMQRVRWEDVPKPDARQRYAGLLVLALELRAAPARTEIAELTRAFNRASNHLPVLLLLRYPASATDASKRLALAASERGAYAQAWRMGEKVGKVSILFDIDPRPKNPLVPNEGLHTGHERLLERLKVPGDVHTLEALSRYWNEVLDVRLLNQQFYQELSNWYFWALRQVRTPAHAGDQGDDVRHATAMIRLITRLIFTWFLKEKHLVPVGLFEQDFVYKRLLRPAADDPHGSTYYKAVLQNLFFATLNTEMRDKQGEKNRRFRPATRSARGHNEGYGETGYLRYEALFTPQGAELALDLFNRIPFLNGGLFECLDPNPEAGAARVLIDCFSDGNQGKLHLPDELFFGLERVVNLAGDYGDMARKREKVRGLLHILKGYTFTITENTPLEEEVALDPELLGKVFENLLASYNPETQTTARKQTGSFYTPREVVEYMVDESLLAYLRPHLPTASRAADEARLRRLLANPDATSELPAPITQQLIAAIDGLKLLDPACGSGAFPMGALQRLTYLLARLDPNNTLWQQQQVERALAPVLEDLRKAGTFNDRQLRAKAEELAKERIAEITETFSDAYELDYGRKLYLIENCLFGVDIQPVAVQITKLRCFIALLVEQKTTAALAQRPDRNLGIRPLPNLETKFVAANTLLRLQEDAAATARRDQGQQMGLLAMDDDVADLRQQLRTVRHDYFTVRGREAKRALKTRDAQLRARLGKALTRTLPGPDAQRLAAWDPYDLRGSADFFSPAWMLGVDEGFDVVIGNPPYVRQEKFSDQKPRLQQHYPLTYTGTADLYVYFYDRALQALRPGGVLCFITSNKFYRAGYGGKLRGLLASTTTLHRLIDFGDAPVFDAIAYPTIVVAEKVAPAPDHAVQTLVWEPGPSIEEFPRRFAEYSFGLPQHTLGTEGWQFEAAPTRELLAKLRAAGQPLGEYVSGRFYRGILTGLNEAFVVDEATRRELVQADPRSAELLKPYLRGRDVKRWGVHDPKLWLIFTRRGLDIEKYPAIKRHLSQYKNQLTPGISGGRKPGSYKWYDIQDNVAYWQEFEKPKILYQEIATYQAFAFDDAGFYSNNKVFIIPDANHYLLGLMNSKVMWYFLNQVCTKMVGGALAMQSIFLTQAPVPKPAKAQHKQIESLVTDILAAKAADDADVVRQLEGAVDEVVYELFGLSQAEIALVQGQ